MSYEYDPNNYRIRRTSVLQNSVTDMLGTVVDVYAEDGTEVWTMNYTSFGMGGGEKVEKIQLDAMFTGKDMDCETGLT